MGAETGKLLLRLAEVDTRLLIVNQRRAEIQKKQRTYAATATDLKNRIAAAESSAKQSRFKQSAEEQRLKDEQSKIIERRKQLSTLGAKAAKIIEREIEISTRAVESVEADLLRAMEQVELCERSLSDLSSSLSKVQGEFERDNVGFEAVLTDLGVEFDEFSKIREQVLTGLDDRSKQLYNRIGGKYPGNAVVLAEGGSCKGCFRALPAQLYNKLLNPDQLEQCPGCNRILVRVEQPIAGNEG